MSAAALWSRLEAFLYELAPIAEQANVVLAMHPDELSPKAALEKLYELKPLAETLKKTKP